MKIRIKSYIPSGQKTYEQQYYIEVKRYFFWKKHYFRCDILSATLHTFNSIKSAKKYAVKEWGESVHIVGSFK